MLGRPEDWHPPMLRYRLRSAFQIDWKTEVGQYLFTAIEHGYATQLVEHVKKQANRPGYARHASVGNDHEKAHGEFYAEGFSNAMVAHYLLGTGWGFDAWEPRRTEGDTDLRVRCPTPSSLTASIQVKTPLGVSRDAMRATLSKLPRQLCYSEPSIAFLCAPRTWPIASEIEVLTVPLYGSSHGDGHSVWLPRENRGLFFRDEWSSVGAVATLHYVRGFDRFTYSCVVLLNPNARPECRCEADWFPHARVLDTRDGRFRWRNGESLGSCFPDGTVLV